MNSNNPDSTQTVSQSPRRSFRNFALRTCHLFLGMALLAYVASWFGRYSLIAEILSNFRVQFFIIFGISLAVLPRLKTSRVMMIAVVVVFVASGFESLSIYLPAQQPPPGKIELRLMSHNLLATNTNWKDSIREIRDHDPDVIVLLEYVNQWHKATDVFSDAYPFQIREPRWHGYGIAMFSKYPFASAEAVQLTPKDVDNPALVAKVTVEGQQVRIVACHVMSPTSPFRLKLRNQQFTKLAEIVNQEEIATILVGDFNSTTQSVFLKELVSKTALRDSRQGFGMQASWPNLPWPLSIPIDHAFVSEDVHLRNRFVATANSSDHKPIVIDFSIGYARTPNVSD